MLVAVEGIDGAGKTTLISRLRTQLERRGRSTAVLRRYMVPEITDLYWRMVDADAIDQHGVALLAAADYEVGLRRSVLPALEAGSVVLADKYLYTHLVFFGLRGIERSRLESMFGAVLEPDVVLHVQAPVPVALERLRAIDGKPDLLECALDHRLGLSIGEAFRRYGLGGAPIELREPHFRAHQAAAAERYAAVLPSGRTQALDGTLDEEQLCARALESIGERA